MRFDGVIPGVITSVLIAIIAIAGGKPANAAPGVEYVIMDAPAEGHFEVPLSVFHYGGYGVAGGLGYVLKNKWSVAGQVMWGEGSETIERSFSKTLKITEQGNRDCDHADDLCYRTRSTSNRNQDKETGVMVTLTIPLGRK